MADNGIDSLTTAAILTAMGGGTAVTFTGPFKCLFLSSVRTADNGTDTEWASANSYVNGTGAAVAWVAATAGAPSTATNSATATTITNAPAQTWAGCKVVDSSGTPKTTWWAALTSAGSRAPKTVNSGDTVTVPGTSGWSVSLA